VPSPSQSIAIIPALSPPNESQTPYSFPSKEDASEKAKLANAHTTTKILPKY